MTLYKITGTLAAFAYIALFTAGIVINSAPFRDQLNAGTFSIGALVIVMLIYTPSNVAFLAMLSGLIGGCASIITHSRHLQEANGSRKSGSGLPSASEVYRTESPVASMFRSLVAYLAFMAGILVTTVAPFTTTTPEQYIRLASAVSFFAFVVGYDPTKFQGLMSLSFPVKSPSKRKAS